VNTPKYSEVINSRVLVFDNIYEALHDKFGDSVIPDLDFINNSYLIYIGETTIELTFNEDKE